MGGTEKEWEGGRDEGRKEGRERDDLKEQRLRKEDIRLEVDTDNRQWFIVDTDNRQWFIVDTDNRQWFIVDNERRL